jgi:hypothetical protein
VAALWRLLDIRGETGRAEEAFLTQPNYCAAVVVELRKSKQKRYVIRPVA